MKKKLVQWMTTDRWYTSLLVYYVGLLALQTWERNWTIAVLVGLLLGALLAVQKYCRALDTHNAVTAEHLARAAAERAMSETMQAELEKAVKAGRVHFGGEERRRETLQ